MDFQKGTSRSLFFSAPGQFPVILENIFKELSGGWFLTSYGQGGAICNYKQEYMWLFEKLLKFEFDREKHVFSLAGNRSFSETFSYAGDFSLIFIYVSMTNLLQD